jgi:hypothetical protein
MHNQLPPAEDTHDERLLSDVEKLDNVMRVLQLDCPLQEDGRATKGFDAGVNWI